MAYAVLLSLTQTIDQILNHDEHQYSISDNGKQSIRLLLEQVIRLREFLKKFPKEAKSLETRMRDAANEAEDVMEHFMHEHIRSHLKFLRLAAVGGEVKRTDILYDFLELKFVMKEINSIAEEVAAIEPEIVRPAIQSGPSSSSPRPTPTVDSVTIGLKEDLWKIRDLVCGGSSRRQIIPITGMAGIGKTTLARTVYHDPVVIEMFPVRAWITVSQNYKTENVFADLLFSLEKQVDELMVESSYSTEDKLHQILTLKKYLIVVDDLWSGKAWDDINKAFGDPRKRDGSRIVITTRNEDVAYHANPSSPVHKMNLMDKCQSWDLFKHRVFPNRECPSDLKKIGMDIATVCGGLPLSIVLVASIMSAVTETRSSWESITEDLRSHIPEDRLNWPSWQSPMSVATVAGDLEDNLKEIRGLLCGGSSQRQIILITGMGGIGKTTLTKAVYDDPEVIHKFPVRAWITVSQNYNVENIFADLLYSLEKVVESLPLESIESTVDKLRIILMMKKYFIVLDDLWSSKAWDDIMEPFSSYPYNANGSRIVITTRINTVASHINHAFIYLHEMQFLKADQSWNLLKQEVFQSKECPHALEKAGKDIANGCLGLPLAVVVIARILLTTIDQTQSAWEEVAENVRSLIQNDAEFHEIMSLSYIDLPHHLRPCFLYMGGFPEDNEIRVSKLTKLWMAEGFVENEEEGEEYLRNLVERHLALVMTTKSNGKIESCNLHGFVRDMCKIIALNENVERRMSVAHPDLRCVAKAYASTLRSVICFRSSDSSLVGLRKLRLLRVLDVVDTDAYSLPPQVFDMFHLRYLAFGCPMEIPAAISRLQNLRILIIRPSKKSRKYSKDEVYLPLEIWMLPLLTHLVSFFDLLPNPQGAASALKELLMLSVVKKLICTQEMMKLIGNVKRLAITYLGDRYQQDYQLHNLVLLPQLEKLTLVVKKGSFLQLKANPVFPKTLKKLTLSGWRFPWEDMKAVATLPELQVLMLRDHAFVGSTWNTNEESDEEDGDESDGWSDEDSYEESEVEQFRRLEYLLIDESDLEKWVTHKCHFPVLKHLVLNGCGKLSEIPNAIGHIPSLKLIEVDRANVSLLKCVQVIREEQKEYGRHLQVRQI